MASHEAPKLSSNGRARRRFRAPLCGRALRSRRRHDKSKRPIGPSPGVKSSTMSRAWTYLVPGSCADFGPVVALLGLTRFQLYTRLKQYQTEVSPD